LAVQCAASSHPSYTESGALPDEISAVLHAGQRPALHDLVSSSLNLATRPLYSPHKSIPAAPTWRGGNFRNERLNAVSSISPLTWQSVGKQSSPPPFTFAEKRERASEKNAGKNQGKIR
jgi:hypothetical protein